MCVSPVHNTLLCPIMLPSRIGYLFIHTNYLGWKPNHKNLQPLFNSPQCIYRIATPLRTWTLYFGSGVVNMQIVWNVDDLAWGNLISQMGWVLSKISWTWWILNDRCSGNLGSCSVSIWGNFIFKSFNTLTPIHKVLGTFKVFLGAAPPMPLEGPRL